MMSKNLFWADMAENSKRRVWLILVSWLTWFLYYPVGMAVAMSRVKLRISAFELQENARLYLRQTAAGWLTMNKMIPFLVSILAILCAVQGFSYLHSRRKVDFYHSVPVKKERRFAVITVNSMLIFFVPYLANVLLAAVVAALNGGMGDMPGLAGVVLFGAFVSLLLFAATFALTATAVMLTGNFVITLFATGIFLFYEITVKWIFTALQECFYKYFSYNTQNYTLHLSPVALYIKMMEQSQNGKTVSSETGFTVFQLLVLVAVFTVIAYICYRRRPSEAAGKTMAFPKTKGIIKFLITVPCTLFAGLLLIDAVGTMEKIVVFGLAVTVIVSNCIIEVLYEQDIRAAFKKKYQTVIAGVCVALIFCIFNFDLTGYDKWIPKAEKLDNAVVIVHQIAGRQSYWDENFDYIDTSAHYLEGEGIKDVEAIRELSAKKGDSEEDISVICEVAYRMKNGRTIWREFPVRASEEEVLNKIIKDKAFKKSAYQIYEDSLFEKFKSQTDKKVTYNFGIGMENLPEEDLDIIRELLIKDLDQADYRTLRDELICGRLEFTVRFVDSGYQMDLFNYNIYPSYTNTIGYLKEKGIYKESVPAPEDIERITVTNYHIQDQSAYSGVRYGGAVPVSDGNEVIKEFTDEKQIKELTEALYPAAFENNFRDTVSNNYSVEIRLKSSVLNSSYYRGSMAYVVLSDKIPDWLEKETAKE